MDNVLNWVSFRIERDKNVIKMETDGNFKSKQLTIKCNLQKQKQNKIKN